MPRGHSNQTKQRRFEAFRTLSEKLANIDEAPAMLAQCAIPSARSRFEQLLTILVDNNSLAALQDRTSKMLFDGLLSWTDSNRVSPALESAKAEFRTNVRAYRKVHRLAANTFLLDREAGAAYITSISTIALHRLSTPYPPPGYHISESPEITAQWEDFLHHRPLPDRRRKRSYIHQLDPMRLQRVIGPEESCKLVDAATGQLVGVVLRDLTAVGDNSDDPYDFRKWATEAIADGIAGRRSIRLEDPGKMIQTGYSAGARSQPCFNWVRNVTSRKDTTPEFLASSDFRTSCLFAVAWNMCRSVLHGADTTGNIIDGWEEFLMKNQLPRMDAGVGTQATTGDVTIELGGMPLAFHGMDLAPASGLLNQNYARGVHHEQQPHPFAIQWILHRSHGASAGGHFYIAEYGVKIINAADTLIAWRPSQWHGTSLANYSPDTQDPDYKQYGISFVTPPRLAGVFKKYKNAFEKLQQQAPEVAFGKMWTDVDEAAAEAALAFLEALADGVEEE